MQPCIAIHRLAEFHFVVGTLAGEGQSVQNAFITVRENIAADNELHDFRTARQNSIDASIGKHGADRVFFHVTRTTPGSIFNAALQWIPSRAAWSVGPLNQPWLETSYWTP